MHMRRSDCTASLNIFEEYGNNFCCSLHRYVSNFLDNVKQKCIKYVYLFLLRNNHGPSERC